MTKKSSKGVSDHPVVSHQEWLSARTVLLAKEKNFTKLSDQMSRQRRALPWEKVEKEYVFVGPNGKQPLSALFDGSSQLVIYHFMFHPDEDAGCPLLSRCFIVVTRPDIQHTCLNR